MAAAAMLWPRDAHADVEYAARAGRFEGLRSSLVSGFDIALIGAKAVVRQPASGSDAYLAFYPPAAQVADIVVREAIPVNQYWLDRVNRNALREASGLTYLAWPLRDVVRRVAGLTLDHLVPLVRLDSAVPAARVKVAPAFLTSAPPPYTNPTLRFFFFLRENSTLGWRVVDQQGRTVVSTAAVVANASAPFVVELDPLRLPTSVLILQVTGSFRDSRRPLFQEITFYNHFAPRQRSGPA